MKLKLYIAFLISSFILSTKPNSLYSQNLVNNPCNVGSTSDWPMDGVCYSADKIKAFSNLFTPTQCNATNRDDGWATFTGDGNELTISYTPDSRDAVIHLYSAVSPCSITYIDCSDVGASGVAETIVLPSSINGQAYFIRVERKNSNNPMTGCMSITVTPPPPPVGDPLLRLSLSGMGYSTEAIIRLKPGATNMYDISYDAILFPSGDPAGIELASKSSDNYNLVINSLNTTPLNIIVPLFTTTGTSGSYSIEMTEFNNFTNDYSVVLHDYKLNIDHLLNNGPYIFTGDMNDNDDRFEINGSSTPLPVDILSFKGNIESNKVRLSWSTLTEINNDYFTIEKSKNGLNWSTYRTQIGAGNSNSITNYTEIDKNPTLGISYYRLKQTDFDGQSKYIATISVDFTHPSNFTLYPNPACNDVRILFEKKLEKSEISFQLYNSVGQEIKKVNSQFTNDEKSIKIITSDLANGIHFIKISFGKKVKTFKFLKISN